METIKSIDCGSGTNCNEGAGEKTLDAAYICAICVHIATKDELHKAQLEESLILAQFSVSMRKTTKQVMELPRSEIANDI